MATNDPPVPPAPTPAPAAPGAALVSDEELVARARAKDFGAFDELQSDELRRHIQSAVDALPEIYRTVFILRDVEGMSTEETAEILDISVPTVKTRLHRARIALRDTITGYFNKR